ncbi:hypothetical protein [Burkholderia ubonensis]|uniref:hypothetical protein n=1 Tax=Burkholderia ubonensis TaxID=101571 RepID=UPI0012F9655A|nr:hypothetical protein [Burkholderia ubonensis]
MTANRISRDITSVPKHAQARIDPNLRPPTIYEAIDGKVAWSVLQRGFTVRVPRGELREGERLYLYIGTPWGFNSFAIPVTVSGHVGDISVFVPPERAVMVRAASTSVSYFRFSTQQNSERSTYFMEAPIYPPDVIEAVSGEIPADAADSGITVKIPPYEQMSVDDVVSLYWLGEIPPGVNVQHHRIDSSTVGKELEFAIDARYVAPCKGYGIGIVYTVTRVGSAGKLVAPAARLRVEEPLKPPSGIHFIEQENYIPEVLQQIFESGEEVGYPIEQEAYSGMTRGDQVTCIWLDASVVDGSRVLQKIVQEPQPFRFFVPLDVRIDGTGYVTTLVERGGVLRLASRTKGFVIWGDD